MVHLRQKSKLFSHFRGTIAVLAVFFVAVLSAEIITESDPLRQEEHVIDQVLVLSEDNWRYDFLFELASATQKHNQPKDVILALDQNDNKHLLYSLSEISVTEDDPNGSSYNISLNHAYHDGVRWISEVIEPKKPYYEYHERNILIDSQGKLHMVYLVEREDTAVADQRNDVNSIIKHAYHLHFWKFFIFLDQFTNNSIKSS